MQERTENGQPQVTLSQVMAWRPETLAVFADKLGELGAQCDSASDLLEVLVEAPTTDLSRESAAKAATDLGLARQGLIDAADAVRVGMAGTEVATVTTEAAAKFVERTDGLLRMLIAASVSETSN
ncbi:hypothetical protein [Nocardia lasii]|uniref:Uncharacterized protein n=1 Tax=Nocardia lasii TaxID=1616107 RepID=A0ABW1JVI1_9NOCA